jgi:Family of unknown function (DUF5670)
MNALLWLAGVLLALWLAAWLVFEVAGFAIHLLLLAAVVLLIGWVVRRATGGRTPVF